MMKNLKNYIVFSLSILSLFSYAETNDLDAVEKLLLAKGNENTVILDLRTVKEQKETGIITGAIAKNYFDKDFDEYISKLDKTKTYIVYCRSGGRSSKVEDKMKKVGIDVLNYNKGMNGWLKKKFKTVKYIGN